jgi:hypothetical protein
VRYNVGVAYLLWLISGCGALGLHRFYLGKIGTGLLWMCSGGLCGVGMLYDAVTMARQVREANVRYSVEARVRGELAYAEAAGSGYAPYGAAPYGSAPAPKPDSPEKVILRVARKNGGFVTPGEAALEGDLSVDEARKQLDKLASKGSAEMRVRSSGVVVYFFPEFSGEGRDDFAV